MERRDSLLCSCEDTITYPCLEHAAVIEEWQIVWADKKREEYPQCPIVSKTGLYRLEGKVSGVSIRTEPVIQSSGIFALTSDRAWYRLGQPNEAWIKWLVRGRYKYDPVDPLKIKGSQ